MLITLQARRKDDKMFYVGISVKLSAHVASAPLFAEIEYEGKSHKCALVAMLSCKDFVVVSEDYKQSALGFEAVYFPVGKIK